MLYICSLMHQERRKQRLDRSQESWGKLERNCYTFWRPHNTTYQQTSSALSPVTVRSNCDVPEWVTAVNEQLTIFVLYNRNQDEINCVNCVLIHCNNLHVFLGLYMYLRYLPLVIVAKSSVTEFVKMCLWFAYVFWGLMKSTGNDTLI